jgi:Fe-S cluster biogenesis protein NfuA
MAEAATEWSRRVRSVLDVLAAPLVADGAQVVTNRCDPHSGELSIKYGPGSCATCAMTSADLARLLEGGLRATVGSDIRVIVEDI